MNYDESSKYKTFFDIGLDDENNEKEFAQLRCIIYSNRKKKRVVNNELLKRYLSNDDLSKDELVKVKKILDGSIYTERRNLFSHCKLCSDSFERDTLSFYSSKYKYWEICIPTFPYFPGVMMLYLKERRKLLIENFQALPNEYIEELLKIELDLFTDLYSIFNEDLVGINILFNQLSKSELCIHGHIELMLRDIDEKNIGYQYILERPFDKFSSVLNSKMNSSENILKIPEGIKIKLNNMSISDVKEQVGLYEDILKYYFQRGQQLQNGNIEVSSVEDEYLRVHTVPAATNFVYLTYYKGTFLISEVPELTLDFVPFSKITDNPGDLFCLSINRNYTTKDNVFMRNYSPKIRPSIKVYDPNQNNTEVLKLQRSIYRKLEGHE